MSIAIALQLWEWSGVPSSAVDCPECPPVDAKPEKKTRRKYRLSEGEKARRSKHIGRFQHLATAASAARPPEERARTSSIGGKAMMEKYRTMKAALVPDTPEGFRLRRIDLEGKRDALLNKLIECAETETELPALAVLRAALTEIRAEIPILLDREERATKAAGQVSAAAPRAAIGPAAPLQPAPAAFPAVDPAGNPSADIPATDIPPAIAVD